jgi:hypothetical protein
LIALGQLAKFRLRRRASRGGALKVVRADDKNNDHAAINKTGVTAPRPLITEF